MSHSLCRAIFHVVFSTKERRNLIPRDEIDRTWAYIAGIGRNHGLQVHVMDGTQNHLHVLFELRPEVCLSDAVRTLKANSSRWLRESVATFRWQEGYSAFSLALPVLPLSPITFAIRSGIMRCNRSTKNSRQC
jgi:REP element-mobilizing transposase RayT